MVEFFLHLFDTSDFTPRWTCGNWTAGQGWLHILSDLGVWSAYVAIPCVLAYFVLRRRNIPFRLIFVLFGAFILACGTTHLMEAILFWWPAYRLAGLMKLFTALVSWATVIALLPIVPAALAMRNPRELEREVAGRKKAEDALQQAYAELEHRVGERTAELAEANENLREHTRLTALRADTALMFTRGDELRAVLQGYTELLVHHLDVAFARVWTVNASGEVLELQASAGMYTHLDGAHRQVKVGEFKIGRIAQERRPHLTNAVLEDHWISDPQWASREGMVAFAGYPLVVEDRLIGVLAMFARHPLSDRVLSDLAPVADSVAQYVERRRAVEALRESESTLRRSQEELERRVAQRTADLAAANEALRLEVSERKEAEERAKAFAVELQRSNQELQQFASVASHDLQEPLRKIQAFGDRLHAQFGQTLGERGQDHLSRVRSAATRMRSLIDDLLAFSRVTTKAQPFVPVDLAVVARQVVSDLEGRILQTNGRVEIGTLPAIHADRFQMGQLLQNLIANGLKFHREGQPAWVKIEGRLLNVPEARCELTVQDNGIGFEEKYLDRIFQLFQRLHGRDQYEGTGIGLAICRKIVERHGGTITARSTPGDGATFVITLPLHPAVESMPLV